tara:strand:- start:200 stop:670 length:471 start_codon:yes stop_codon:yes gene_type:complete
MFIDSTLEFCDSVTLSGTGIEEKKGNVLDLSDTTDNALKDLGSGEPIYLVLNVTTAFASGTSVRIDLRSGSNADLESSSPVIHWTTGVVAAANYGTLTGMTIVQLPTRPNDYKENVGIHVTTVGAVTGGVADAFLTKDVPNWQGSATRVPATDPAN